MVNLERYHVMIESEIIQKLNGDKDYSSSEDDEYEQKNSEVKEEADDKFSETFSSTDYDHLE